MIRKNKTKNYICLIISAVLLLSTMSPLGFADETNGYDYDSQMAALNEEKEIATQNRINAQNKVEQLKREQAAVIEEKMALEERNIAAQKEIELIVEQIELLELEIKTTEEKIERKAQEVEEAKNNEELQLEKYRSRIRAMEENGSYNILALILQSSSYSQLLASLDDYGEIMTSDQRLYDQLVAAREEHERLEEEYIAYKAECEQKQAEYEAKKLLLEQEQAELEAQIAESEQIIAEYEEKIEAAEKEQKAMAIAEANAAASAASFIANYNAAKTAMAQSGASSGDNGGSSFQTYEGASGSGSYVWPFPGHYIITSTFGFRSSTSSWHTGVDIDGYQSMGSAIVAADGGTVIMAEYYGGYGNCIIIDHGNGMSTLYAHLSSMNVSAGDSVSQNQTLGGVGNTGTCYGIDGVHLHFEVLVNGSQVDPLSYLSAYSYSFY